MGTITPLNIVKVAMNISPSLDDISWASIVDQRLPSVDYGTVFSYEGLPAKITIHEALRAKRHPIILKMQIINKMNYSELFSENVVFVYLQ